MLLVHGVLGQPLLYWNLFRRRLESDGFVVHEVILPRYMFGDLLRAADVLRGDVEAASQRHGAAQVDLVCHSVGGLVARHYLQSSDGAERVRNVVFLGTPHRGTHLAHFLAMAAPVARQARPGSWTLQRLGARRAPAGVRMTNFWSPVDGIVVPGSNSKLAGARNVKVLSHHWGYLVSRRIYEQVRDALRLP